MAAGGASTAIEQALGRPIDIAINHDPEAIAMHAANHPWTQHLCKSVWKVGHSRRNRGAAVVGLAWFSPDFKHVTKAKRQIAGQVPDPRWHWWH